ncbi:hypothetical protein HDU98_002660 [Podochytrium sp. JEL0797]|nr:hypothetical protein HDU98_002660 [Podochytrium sp. JEL0797]
MALVELELHQLRAKPPAALNPSSAGDAGSPISPISAPLTTNKLVCVCGAVAAPAKPEFRCDFDGCDKTFHSMPSLSNHKEALHSQVFSVKFNGISERTGV